MNMGEKLSLSLSLLPSLFLSSFSLPLSLEDDSACAATAEELKGTLTFAGWSVWLASHGPLSADSQQDTDTRGQEPLKRGLKGR